MNHVAADMVSNRVWWIFGRGGGIDNLDMDTRKTLFQIIDTFLRDSKARHAYSA